MSGRVLALDIANTTGWAVADATGIIASGAHALRRSASDGGWQTIYRQSAATIELARLVQQLLAEHAPRVLALETPFIAPGRTRAAVALLVLRGAALAAAQLIKPDIILRDVPVAAWQSWASRAAGWRKRPGRAGDEADARAIARYVVHELGK